MPIWNLSGTLGCYAECRTNHDYRKIWSYDCSSSSFSVLCCVFTYCKQIVLLECRYCIRCDQGFESVSMLLWCFQSFFTFSGSFCANWGGRKRILAILYFHTYAFYSPSLQTSWNDGIARCGLGWTCWKSIVTNSKRCLLFSHKQFITPYPSLQAFRVVIVGWWRSSSTKFSVSRPSSLSAFSVRSWIRLHFGQFSIALKHSLWNTFCFSVRSLSSLHCSVDKSLWFQTGTDKSPVPCHRSRRYIPSPCRAMERLQSSALPHSPA